MNPRVSVVIPFYNAEHTLLDAVRSVFAQTYLDWELVLVDDGSTDRSLALAESIRDPRVRVIADGENRGVIVRRRQLTEHARGDYVAMLDADDLMCPERLQRQVEYLQSNPECDLVCSAAVSLSNDMRAVGLRDVGVLDLSPKTLLRTGSIIQPSVMARTRWLRENPYRDGYDRAEDRELWVRTHAFSAFRKILVPLTFYREVGVFSLQKFIKSYAAERRIILDYGPDMVGRGMTMLLYARSLLKSIVVRMLHRLRLGELLVRRRYQENEALTEYQAIIDRIRSTPIPGVQS